MESNRLVTPCHFRAEGVYCKEGHMVYSVNDKEISVEGEKIDSTCPACEGKGVILTPEGRELITFFDTFLRPKLYEICSDYIDDKMGLS